MGQLVLLVVAAAWAAVLIPPLLRSRIENRPNSSVTDFRNQLSSLQKALPPRSVTVRSMARPLVPPPPLPPPPSPLRRPAAAGRPVLRSGVRTHQPAVRQSTLPAPPRRTPPPLPAEVHSRPHGSGARAADRRRHRAVVDDAPVVVDDGVKRRRANILFALVLIAGSSLFLAATMQTESLYYVAGAALVGLLAYVYLLVQRRKQEVPAGGRTAPAPPRLRRDELVDDLDELAAPRRSEHAPVVRYEERPARTRRGPGGEHHHRTRRAAAAAPAEDRRRLPAQAQSEKLDEQLTARQRPRLPDVPGDPTAAILRARVASELLDEPMAPRRRPRPPERHGESDLARRPRPAERGADHRPRQDDRPRTAPRRTPARPAEEATRGRAHEAGTSTARRRRWSQAV